MVVRLKLVALLLCLCVGGAELNAQDGRVALATLTADTLPASVDCGPVPASQRLTLTLTLAPDPARSAALDQFLSTLIDPASSNYRHWLTPAQFAASYGATAEQVAAAIAWAQLAGLAVDAVSPSGARMTLSGYPAQVERAFKVELRALKVNGVTHFAAASRPSLAPADAALFNSMEGLDDLTAQDLTIASLAAKVDANVSGILAVDASAATGSLSAAQRAGYATLLRQAAAQGITAVVARNSASTGFPADLPDLTAITFAAIGQVPDSPATPRPTWQSAPGLPADGLRHTPDLMTESLAAFTLAVAAIVQETPGMPRLGNIAPELYALAPTTGLYTQPDLVAAGTWEAATGLGHVDLAELVRAFPHGTSAAALSLTSSIANPVHGHSFTLTATINSASGGAVPTGTITFTSTNPNFASSSIAIDATGKAVTQAYLLPGGAYPITATYAGDATYSGSSATANVTVQAEAANFTISAPATVTLGGAVTATVTLASASGLGTPSASVTVTPAGITSAQPITQAISGSGGTASAQFSFTTNKAGSVSLQASCTSADASFTCFTPQTATVTVPQATPTIALAVTPTSPIAGSPVTLSAPVSGISGIQVTGSVQFFDGTNSIGFGSAPNASYSGLLLSGSNHAITAVYQGDANYARATSNLVNVSVGTATTTTTVNASALTAAFGQPITLNITVASAASVNGTPPSGSVTFTGIPGITSAPVSGGATTLTLSSLTAGTYTIGTAYSGDSNYSASAGNTIVVTITPSVASLNASLSTPVFTTASTSALTVTITLPGSAQLPSGTTFLATIPTVKAYTGAFTINTGGNTGTGSITINAPPAGMYSLQVTCPTNPNFTCVPATLSISSTATGTTATTTVLTLSPAKPVTGQAVTLTATVSAAAAATAANPLAGSVVFYDGTTQIGSGTVSVTGGLASATASVTLTGATTHVLTAVYAGNGIYATSTSPAVSVVTTSAPAVVLTSSAATGSAGLSVVLTATLNGATSSGVSATGTVSFYLAGSTPTLLGTAVASSSGTGVSVASFSTSVLPAGSNSVYAVYSGDSNFAAATSNIIAVGVTDYALAFVPSVSTITRGQAASVTGVVTAINGFSGTVVLACVPPAGAAITCSFNPPSLTGGGTTTLIIGTATNHGLEAGPQARVRGLGLFGGASLAALFCCLLPRGHRLRLPALLLLLLGLSLSASLGCGLTNLNSTAGTTGITPLGTVNLVINTASGASGLRHDYTYQVTVQ